MDIWTVGQDAMAEFTEKKSVFRSYSFFVSTEDDAAEKISYVQNLNNQATHNVYAYSLRACGIQRFSDAGEPQGTAGMPVLKVIQMNGLLDTCIVVTRYFGGVLLGVGGLVRAYTRAAAMAVEASGKAKIVVAVTFCLEYGYDLHNLVIRFVESVGAQSVKQTFTDKVCLCAVLPEDSYIQLKDELSTRFYSNMKITELQRGFARMHSPC